MAPSRLRRPTFGLGQLKKKRSPGQAPSLFATQCCVKRATDCNILFLVDWDCYFRKISFHRTHFFCFKVVCSTWINMKHDLPSYWTSHMTHTTRTMQNFVLKISIFSEDYFIFNCFSVAIVFDGLARNYLYIKWNSSYMQILAIQLRPQINMSWVDKILMVLTF